MFNIKNTKTTKRVCSIGGVIASITVAILVIFTIITAVIGLLDMDQKIIGSTANQHIITIAITIVVLLWIIATTVVLITEGKE